MADWSSLPPDLIRRVGDCLLADDDIDYYMNMRRLPQLALGRRFRPRRWVMLDETSKDDDTRLFVNVSASSGGSDPTLLFAMDIFYGLDLWCADPASERFSVQLSRHCPFDSIFRTSMLAYRGDVCVVDEYASIVKIAGAVPHPTTGELAAEMVDVLHVEVSLESAGREVKNFKGRNYLAESAGDLLLIRLLPPDYGVMEVYRVDVERKAVEPVKSIGGRALFLGDRCLSVDAAKFPSVDGDCVYYSKCYETCQGIYRYNLSDGTPEGVIPGPLGYDYHAESFRVRPFSLVQVLHTWCNRGRSRCISVGAELNLPSKGWCST